MMNVVVSAPSARDRGNISKREISKRDEEDGFAAAVNALGFKVRALYIMHFDINKSY